MMARRVLLVDDDSSVLRLAARFFTEPVWESHAADCAEQALASAREVPPDLVIADLDMPRIDGVRLIETLRRSQPCLPAILMSGFFDGRERIEVAGLALVSKPFSFRDLLRLADEITPPHRS
jgi:DNA-binding response OmpR family regulator